ncbi:YwqG family protein [Aquimarina sp. AU58]|uniref:YwqG family protein n=1 Tax=Aquimarina sp. AU58 TaxID=1874112 RepID=UPI000D6E224B|nr:YwqG family protein [Aquimarina sp. AU58]
MKDGILKLESPSGSGIHQIREWKNQLLTATFKGVYSWNGQKWKRMAAKAKGQTITTTDTGEIFVGAVNGQIYHSQFGETWQKLIVPIDEDVCAIKKTSLGTLLVGTKYGKIYRSVDNGQTFMKSETPDTAWYIVSRIIEDNNALISINAQEIAIISQDDGLTWEELHYFSNNAEIPQKLYSTQRTSSHIQLIDGGLITFNNKNFIPQGLSINENKNVTDVCLIDETLYAIIDLSAIHYTTDLKKWKKLPLKVSRKFYFKTICATADGELMIGGGNSEDGCILVDLQQYSTSTKKGQKKKSTKITTKGLNQQEKKQAIAIQYFRNEDFNPDILFDIERLVVVSSRIKTLKKKPLVFESKYGGSPDFLSYIEWPIQQGVPMLFLGQVNLEELNTLAPQKKLPAKGILYFFADTEYFETGKDTEICPVKVVYQKETKNNEKIDIKIPSSKTIDTQKIKFQYQISLPDSRNSLELQLLEQKMELLKLPVNENFDVYFSHPIFENENYGFDSRGILAYPVSIEGDPKEYKMNYDVDIDSHEAFEEKMKMAQDQNLLFEWNDDDGDLSFFITNSDLEKLNFNKVWGVYIGT